MSKWEKEQRGYWAWKLESDKTCFTMVGLRGNEMKQVMGGYEEEVEKKEQRTRRREEEEEEESLSTFRCCQAFLKTIPVCSILHYYLLLSASRGNSKSALRYYEKRWISTSYIKLKCFRPLLCQNPSPRGRRSIHGNHLNAVDGFYANSSGNCRENVHLARHRARAYGYRGHFRYSILNVMSLWERCGSLLNEQTLFTLHILYTGYHSKSQGTV